MRSPAPRRAPSRTALALRTIAAGAGASACVLFGSLGTLAAQDRPRASPSDDYVRGFREVEEPLRAEGAASCQGCHQGAARRASDKTRRDEYALWYDEGRGNHARAYQTLQSEPSRRMAAVLHAAGGGASDPTQRADCLACHALAAPEELRGRRFALEEGVSCEACHGRSERWIRPHQYYGAWHGKTTDEWRELGMYDTRSVLRTAQRCLECHLGSRDKAVTHDMMGAGHPDLTFEFAGDLEHVPSHWSAGNSALGPHEGSWHEARRWAVGQAVTLYESMQRVLRWADDESQPTPDFSLLDCFACHHEFANVPGRRPARRRLDAAVPPGEPLWNAASWAAARSLLKVVLGDEKRARADQAVVRLLESLRLDAPDRARVRAAAQEIAALADELAAEVYPRPFDRARTHAVLRALLADAEFHAAIGPRGGEQGLRALHALYRRAWGESPERPKKHAEIVAQIDGLEGRLFKPKGSGTTELAGVLEPKRTAPEQTPLSFDFDPDAYEAACKRILDLLGQD